MKTLTQFRTLCCSNSIPLVLTALIIFLSSSCSQSPENRPSPLRSDSTQLGSNLLTVIYSSPGVKDRQIWGELVEYDKMWRTGANEATIFTTDEDILLDSIPLPKGKYSLFTIPGQDEWVVIFNKEWNQWGSYQYDDSLDAARIVVKPVLYEESEERMNLYFEDEFLKFRWEKLGWSILIR